MGTSEPGKAAKERAARHGRTINGRQTAKRSRAYGSHRKVCAQRNDRRVTELRCGTGLCRVWVIRQSADTQRKTNEGRARRAATLNGKRIDEWTTRAWN